MSRVTHSRGGNCTMHAAANIVCDALAFHPLVPLRITSSAPSLGFIHAGTEADHQSRLNITEIAMPAASAAPAAAPAAATEAAAEEEKPKEKTIFTVKLEKIDAAQKAKVIREVKAMMPNMNLVEVSPSSTRRQTAIVHR